MENIMKFVATREIPKPLEDVYFLRSLFPYLTVESLQESRLVNKMWCEMATPVLNSKGMVYFDGHYDEEDPPPNWEETCDFFRDVKNFMQNPPTLLQPYNVCLGVGAKHTEQNTEILKFFETYGPKIKHLRLDYEFHSHFQVSDLRNWMTTYLSSLQCLDIRNMPLAAGRMTRHQELLMVNNTLLGVGGVSSDFPVFWTSKDGPRKTFRTVKRLELWNYNAYVGEMGKEFLEDLLQALPSLEVIKLVDRYYTNMMNNVLKAMILNPLWVPRITQLIFDNCGSPSCDDMELLSELNLHLKVLRIGTLPDLSQCQQANYLQSTLNKQSSTLEELQFGNYVGRIPITVVLPVFPKLKILELTQDVPSARQYNVQFGPIKYAEVFPKLQILSNSRSKRFYRHDDLKSLQRCPYEGSNFFRNMTNLWKSLFPNDGQVCVTLRILDLPYPKNPDTPFFRRIAKMFPEVCNESLNALR